MKPNRKTQNSVSPQFQTLRWRLLGSYLIIMVAIRLISDLLVYHFFTNSLYQQLDNRILNLAQAAAHSLVAIKQDSNAVNETPYRPLDGDGDLDIPWQNLRKPNQSVEWFASDQKRLAFSGILFSDFPLQPGFETFAAGTIRSLMIPAYSYNQQQIRQLEGYVRVSESTESIEGVLSKLRWGLTLGGCVGFGLIGVGGMWLTQQSIKPIEQSFKQLQQFTADASHELRSPLTVIKTSVQVLETHANYIYAEDREQFQAIISATNQMSRLVEDLLLLARTDQFNRTSDQSLSLIVINELLEEVVELLDLNAEAKNIVIQFKPQTDVKVKGDASQLFRLFRNLIENALQYTPPGGTVTLSNHREDQVVWVDVKDTGIGIASEHLPFVFDRLWRADTARTYCEDGSGLGLAISQAISRRHGGEITVKSKVGVGSCFQVRLPVA
ncbi:cell wall metabolism sensor histidine kinase WalK [Lyngbya sp. PCC 8106]|uniref:sensor histidine kinase n=1 Tax=Lyngbya sp. (strain PCC 8106) TaxID=313612 RepID=UPI0000EACF11|nr:HAMP domain-containing sensor histidine kinase [Lyngbya sp. PCC 8106]EAW33855.1 Histidine Kinase [Lyngbya sp. PCC 8106]